jgi:hypothetical protein
MPSLSDKRLLVVTGKGGVGKSAVSAAAALHFARQGRRTLVCEVNTEDRIGPLLNKEATGTVIAELEPNLWAVNIRPADALREYALMVLKFQALYKAVFENRVVRYLLRFIPSVQELVMLGKILYHVRETRPDGSFRFDSIVVDAPATGHAISFLLVPEVILDSVPPGPLARDAKVMRDLLIDPSVTAALLVSLPEDMPVNETLELAAALRDRVKIQVGGAILNGFISERFSPEDLEEVERGALESSDSPLSPVIHGHRARSLASKEALGKLEAGLGLKVCTLPRLYRRRFDREAIDELSRLLGPHLEATA